jgi:hypothetical protein
MRPGPLAGLALVALAAAGCVEDASGPRTLQSPGMGLVLSLQGATGGIVDIDRVRAVVTRPDDESVVLDTLVQVPAGTDTLELTLRVPVTSESETFFLTLEFITPAGEVAFIAGPVQVTATTSSDAPVVPLELEPVYTGPGANAAAVRILEKDVAVATGDTIELHAEAVDDTGTPIPGTPIGWSSLDPLRAEVPDARVGRVAGGLEGGLALIVARLLTGQSDTVAVIVFRSLTNSVTDPLGDTFETSASDGLVPPDVVVFGAEVEGGELVIQIEFAQPVVSVVDGGPNVAVGFVDIDVDQDSTTGGFSNTDGFRPDTGSTGMGIEYYIQLFAEDTLGNVPIIDYTGELMPDSIRPVYSGNLLIMRIPLSALGNDDGKVNLATVLGTQPEPTDIAPNSGHLAVDAPLGVSAARPAPKAAPAIRRPAWPRAWTKVPRWRP